MRRRQELSQPPPPDAGGGGHERRNRAAWNADDYQARHGWQLAAAPGSGVEVSLVQASAEAVPLADASFDIVFCDHGRTPETTSTPALQFQVLPKLQPRSWQRFTWLVLWEMVGDGSGGL